MPERPMRTVWIVQHDDAEPPSLILTVLRRLKFNFLILRPDQKALPAKLAADCSALVVMGGPQSVTQHESIPWIPREMALLKEAIDTARPVLAMDFGAHLLAAAAGGNVYPGDAPKEIGWTPIKLTPEGQSDPLAQFLANPRSGDVTHVFQWHGDTFDLPPGAALLATETRFPQQVIRVGQVAYGFQFHFEVTEQIIRQWAASRRSELSANGLTAEDLLTGLKQHMPLLNRRGEEIVRAFGTLVESSAVRGEVHAQDAAGAHAKTHRRQRIELRRLDGPWDPNFGPSDLPSAHLGKGGKSASVETSEDTTITEETRMAEYYRNLKSYDPNSREIDERNATRVRRRHAIVQQGGI
jgi:GMP synthase (glutamine-hydrolysing)